MGLCFPDLRDNRLESLSPKESESESVHPPVSLSLFVGEKNTYLRRAVHQLVTGAYNRSSQGLAVCADHLSKLQGFGQETLDTVSDANDALEKMKEQLDIVTAESILPLFKKPLTGLRMQTADTETDSSI